VLDLKLNLPPMKSSDALFEFFFTFRSFVKSSSQIFVWVSIAVLYHMEILPQRTNTFFFDRCFCEDG